MVHNKRTVSYKWTVTEPWDFSHEHLQQCCQRGKTVIAFKPSYFSIRLYFVVVRDISDSD